MWHDILAILRKWYRFLKSGGFVAFTCPPETAFMAPLIQNIYARVLGVSLPHILEPLGTQEKCRNLLNQAGFKDIEIKIEPSERYRPLGDNRLYSIPMSINFKANPLLAKLSQKQLNQLQVEYKTQIEKLATDQGIWENTTKFFVRARK
jgi:hypothetical protein